MAAEESPRFEHDCSECTFLGQFESPWGGRGCVYDLYFCRKQLWSPTVIARGSSMPHDYTSGMLLAGVDPVLAEALERARRRGLVSVDFEPRSAAGLRGPR